MFKDSVMQVLSMHSSAQMTLQTLPNGVRACSRASRLTHPGAATANSSGGRGAGHTLRCSAAAGGYQAPPLPAGVAASPSDASRAYAAPSALVSPEPTTFELVCPICIDTQFALHADRAAHNPLRCPRCARTFNTERGRAFVDLTLTSGVTQRVFKESLWGGVEIFRNPLVSFVYERGWRQGFAWAGFPGVEKEFDMAMNLLRPAYGELLVDMSCGSGIFSRRFATSKRFAGVIAADFSETMLAQTQQTFDDDDFVNDGSVLLLRADVGRLPFATGSVAAVHAGAAIHCWPNPQLALAEISRVLKPGGVFVGTTFLKAAAPLGEVFGDDAVRVLNRFDPSSAGSGRNYRWWEESELRDLAETVGLVDFQRDRRMRFIMFSAAKPASAAGH